MSAAATEDGQDDAGSAPVSVLLMEYASPELPAVLGEDRSIALRAEMTAEAESWGRELAGDFFDRATPGVRLSDDVARMLGRRPGGLLVIWPCLPRLRPEHAAGALDDLAAGSDVVLGPLIDGGLYLLGLSRMLPDVLSAVENALQSGGTASGSGAGTMPDALAAAAQGGLEIGYLRPERALRTEADIMAARADPLTPPELLRLLE